MRQQQPGERERIETESERASWAADGQQMLQKSNVLMFYCLFDGFSIMDSQFPCEETLIKIFTLASSLSKT